MDKYGVALPYEISAIRMNRLQANALKWVNAKNVYLSEKKFTEA